MENTSLDDILNGNSKPAEAPEPVSEPEAPQTEAQPETIGQPRDEHGRFAPQEETGVEPAPEPEQQQEAPPAPEQLPREEYTALRAVRDENKELKQQLAAIQQQWQAFQNQQQTPQQTETPPDFWDNPTGVISSEAKRAAQMAIAEFQQQQQMERLDAAEAAAKARYPDYGDAFGAFQQAVQTNPALVQQMRSATDPAEFAYKTGKRAMELEQVGSLDALLAAERAKWEAEAKAVIQPRQNFPASTVNDRSTGSRRGPEFAGPTPLNAILKE